MKYIFGKAKKGNTTYFFVKDAVADKIEPYCTRYLKHKTMQNRSVNTVRRIALCLSYYMNFLDSRQATFKSVASSKYAEQATHFSDYLQYIKGGCHTEALRPVSNNTANCYLQAVFGLYEFLARNETLPFLKVLSWSNYNYASSNGGYHTFSYKSFDGYLVSDEHKSRCATEEDIKTILNACTCLRDKLLILIMEETGLRIGEALGIKYSEDIDYKNHRIHVRYRRDNLNKAFAKYAEERYMRISDSTFDALNLYLAENADLLENTDYLFIVLNGPTAGRPLTASTFYSALATISKNTGLTVTNHMLRHYFADERRKANWSITEISKSLGHRNIATTEKYLHVTNDETEEAQKRYLNSVTPQINISDFL